MKPNALKQAQQGFALIAAIVLIVVLAAMAGFVATMVGGQSANQQLERMTQVADLAAQAGLEWGAYQALKNSNCVAANTPFTPPPNTSLSVMTVRVSCTPGGPPYRISAIATFGVPANTDYVERSKTADFL
jgi:MSHA biogenesis protein MshP